MKETVKASLAGIGFVFDRDAFETLEIYLDNLSRSYGSNPDREEIISDIEARVVEIILSRQNTGTVVGKSLIDEAIAQLGMPEETAGGDIPPVYGAEVPERRFPRRLYRDLDGAKLGGVFNGLSRYFDTDPSLIRISTAIPLVLLIIIPPIAGSKWGTLYGFLGSLIGALFLLYFILWIAIPAARTPRQRLEMQGRRITASEIEREMQASAVEKESGYYARHPESVIARIFSFFGRLILFFMKMILLLIGFVFALAALGIIVGIIGLLVGAPWFAVHGAIDDGLPLLIGGMSISAAAFSSMVLGLLVIPLIWLVYQMIRIVLNGKNNRTFMWILWGAWILLLIFTSITIIENGPALKEWRGVGIEYRSAEEYDPDSERGWELYEKNVREYRDSLERARNGVGTEPTETETDSSAVPHTAGTILPEENQY